MTLPSWMSNLGFGSGANAPAPDSAARMPGGMINRTGSPIDGVASAPDPNSQGMDPWGNSIPNIPNPGAQAVQIPGAGAGMPGKDWGAALGQAGAGLQAAAKGGSGAPDPVQFQQIQYPQAQMHGVDPGAIAALIQAQQQRMLTMQRPIPGLLTRGQ